MPRRKQLPVDIICKLYREGLTLAEIAERYKVHVQTIVTRLDSAGVERRTPQEAASLCVRRGRNGVTRYWLGKKQSPEMVEKRISKIRGDNHYAWKGGKSRRPYRGKVAKVECAHCGARQNLCIHHIDFDYYNNDETNLAVLCVSCHLSLHKKAYWDAVKAGKEPPRSTAPSHWLGYDWRAWRDANRETFNTKHRQWRKEHPR